VLARLTGALTRALLVAVLIVTPSLFLPSDYLKSPELILLLSLIAGLLTFIEYASSYPSLVEFRDAPPLNRIRYISLLLTVVMLTLFVNHGTVQTNLTTLVAHLGILIGDLLDFAYSPVRLVVLLLPDNAPRAEYDALRAATGIAYLISILSVLIFLFLVKVMNWPASAGAFNVWTNLPLFDPTAGGDVVYRLNRDAGVNMILGFLLPFLIPAIAKVAIWWSGPFGIDTPHTLIWLVAAWAFLPASMVMRGIALAKIADMIEEKRRRTYANAETLQAV
jgi:hypothetical protein